MTSDEKTSESKAFKHWFDRAAAKVLAGQIRRVHPSFDQKAFVRAASRGLSDLEFGARVQQFSDALRSTLPESVPESLAVLTESLPEPRPDCEAVTDGWLLWPMGQFIADHGLPYFEESMTAMVELTKRFSSEFAVRPFVEHRPKETFARLLALTGDGNPHVRRWCSEGTRPRLPWGKKLRALVASPKPIWPILEALKDDPELYVRRSVANNLNDIAKDHPGEVIRRCKRWWRQGTPDRRWVVKHALRTLIKGGNPDALSIVGFAPPNKITTELGIRPKKITVGGEVTLSASLESSSARSQELVIDYVVHFVRKGGKSSAKVFKWKTIRLAKGASLALTKRHAFKTTTIRALYPGVHRVELQVNGVRVAESRFRLS